ncbi:DMT family transporter [Telluribacter humicola]|uniref:DMT family transporter n=1 Tax=Telluribacter humicola TaxID=1720261 RepID=UPI001A96ED20|nr:EamA family transporter [Telluribacter humicola]
MNKKLAYIFIAAAAFLWGMIGLFVSQLYDLGFTTNQVVAVRALSAAAFLGLYTLLTNWRLLKIKLSDSKYFVGTGIISIVLFNWCMFSAIRETSISVATILLYTAPAFVTILSRFLFNEVITTRKVLALVTTLAGCGMVVGIGGSATDHPVSLYGILLGLGSGFFYALYSVFGKYALQKYDSLTVTLYTFVFAAVAITPFSDIQQVVRQLHQTETWLYIAGLCLFSTTLAYLLYTKGLQVIESSRASIVATIEPVVASLIGVLVFREVVSIGQYLGIGLVLAAVVIVQEPAPKATDGGMVTPK